MTSLIISIGDVSILRRYEQISSSVRHDKNSLERILEEEEEEPSSSHLLGRIINIPYSKSLIPVGLSE